MDTHGTMMLDLSGPRSLVTIDGVTVQGVTYAKVEVEPDRVPMLVLHVVRFKVAEAELPAIHSGRTAKENDDEHEH